MRPRYTTAEKMEIVRFARATSVRDACHRFHVARSSIYLWTAQLTDIPSANDNQQDDTVLGEEANALPLVGSTATFTTPSSVDDQLTKKTPTSQCESVEFVRGTSQGIVTPPVSESRSHATCTTSIPNPLSLPSTLVPAMHTTNTTVSVGYQGANGGFAHVAAQRAFPQAFSESVSPTSTFDLTGYPQTSHVLDALRKHEIDFALVPTDILLSNTHHATLNQVVAFRLKMVGEVIVEEDASVCALLGTELCDADCVVSDWRTLQRYEEYIVQLEMQFSKSIYREVVWDSAAGCRLVQEEQTDKTLVLCTSSAAATHGLVVLQGRLSGSPTHTRYTILGRCGTTPLIFDRIPAPAMARCTLLVKGTASAILDIISAFAFRGLQILSFHTRGDEDQHLRSYVISYRASTNPLVEIGLQHHLGAASERVIALGDFTTHTVNSSS